MTIGDLSDPAIAVPRESVEPIAPDDDSRWRQGGPNADADAGVDPTARRAALLDQCNARLDRAANAPRAQQLISEVNGHGCTALAKGRDCTRCRICPSEGAWAAMGGYYNARKGKVFICAEKAPSEAQVEATLVHELIHAYDHCRLAMRVPFVGWQAPWALSSAASACSEVRAYLHGSLQRHAQSGGLGGFGAGGGLLGGFGGSDSFGGGSSDGGGGFGGGSNGDGGGFGGGSYDGGASGEWIGDGGGGGGNDAASAGATTGWGHTGAPGGAPAPSDPERVREAVYGAAYRSLLHSGRCAEEGREPRAVLDAVFNACLEDAAPFVKGSGAAGGVFSSPPPFPPFPPAVDHAQSQPATRTPPAVVPPEPSAPSGGAGEGGLGGSNGDEVHRAKWGQA